MSTVLTHVDIEKQERVLDAFRRWGYLQANLDPLDHFQPLAHPELDLSGEVADAARRIYSSSIGVESCCAVWTPIAAFVAPGPRVTSAMPGRPVSLP